MIDRTESRKQSPNSRLSKQAFNERLFGDAFFIRTPPSGMKDRFKMNIVNCAMLSAFVLSMKDRPSVEKLTDYYAGYYMSAYKRLDIAERLKKVPLGYFNDTNLDQITGIATAVLDVVENQGANVLVLIFSGLMNSVVLLICVLFFDWRLGLINLIGMAIYMFITSSMERKSRALSPVRQKNEAALVSRVLESLQGMSVIKCKSDSERRSDHYPG